MIARAAYAWHETPQPRQCPIPCCTVQLFLDEMGEHIRARHPEPPVPAEIIVLTHHSSEVKP